VQAMKILKTHDTKYRDEIISLYIEAFSTGLSKQSIDTVELNKYFDVIFNKGEVLLAIEKEEVLGGLMTCPLKYDKSLPKSIPEKYPIDKCVYLAEMMVAEKKRGKGIGGRLLSEFFESVDRKQYSDAFLRVWKENHFALDLYRKMGFEPVATIQQTKTKADGSGTFTLEKIYLHKEL
jgi:diamine N-acetyltransferase